MLTHLLDPPSSPSSLRPARDNNNKAASSPSAKRKAEEQPTAAGEPSPAAAPHYYHPQVRRTGSGEILSRGDGCGARGVTSTAGEGPAKRLKLLERRLEGSEVGTDANTDGSKTISLPAADFSLNPPAGQYTPCSEAAGAAGGVQQQHSNAVCETNSHFATSEVAKLALTISQSSHWSHDNDIFSGPFRPPPPPPPTSAAAAMTTTTTTCSNTNNLNNNRSLEPTSASSAAIFGSPGATDQYHNNTSAFNTPNRRSSASAAANDDGGAGAAAVGPAGGKASAGAGAASIAKAAEPPALDVSAVGAGAAGGTPAAPNINAQDDSAHGTRKKRKSPHFTEAEDEMILKGYEKFGDNWQAIITWGNFDPEVRTAASVRGRFSRLPAARKKGFVVMPSDPELHPHQQQAPAKPILSNHSTGSLEGQQQQQPHAGAQHETPARQQQRGWKGEGATLPHLLWSPTVDAAAGGGGGNGNNGESAMTSATCSPSGKAAFTKKIHEYFQRSGGGGGGGGGGIGRRARPPTGGDDDAMQHISLHDEAPTDAEDDFADMIQKTTSAPPARRDALLTQRLIDELEQTRAQLAHAFESNETLRSERDAFAKGREDLLAQVSSLESESDALRRDAQQNIKNIESRAVAELAKARARIVDVLREKARNEAREVRQKAAKESLRLGGLKYDRHGIGFHERWESGYLAKEQEEALEALVREREEIERKRKLLSKRLKQSKAAADAAAPDLLVKPDTSNPPPPSMTAAAGGSAGTISAPATAIPTIDRITQAEYFERSEIYSLRLAALKREELELRARQAETHRERTTHIREMRRIAEEDRSRFSHHPLLNDRYLLMSLIGKGGFSEVYKAFDLVELRTVACKIHSLNDQWGEERKEFYIKHSLREYRIQKILDHPRVVKLFDVFEYDHLSFCTVMEYVCEGKDLESHLGMVKTVPEREARSIITQVVAALRYLNELDQPIIHYDLKPGNILYHKGEVKVTDFGLSKIVEQSEPTSFRNTPGMAAYTPAAKDIELTSIGAGTYFYLPPEVFLPQTRNNKEPLTISSKVDVWSLGCVFFELLYGVKPFGNDQSQQTILKEGTITRDAIRLEFPAKPVVSQETKTFILRCLEYRKDKRPDVLTLSCDPYICPPLSVAKDPASRTTTTARTQAA
ncbi:hypothetical protein HDU88_003750 [Geranomyces variabilis]|nr:hypothetical protein HDU88_003750 [Geranomyces variabilis]